MRIHRTVWHTSAALQRSGYDKILGGIERLSLNNPGPTVVSLFLFVSRRKGCGRGQDLRAMTTGMRPRAQGPELRKPPPRITTGFHHPVQEAMSK